MIDPRKEAEADELIEADQLSGREIARRVGIARGTVQALRSGKRPRDASRKAQLVREQRAEESKPFDGPAVRCPGCGGLVQMPCHACRVRRLKRDGSIPPINLPQLEPGEQLSIALRYEDPERYQEVRRQIDLAEMLAEADPLDDLAPSDLELWEIEEAEREELERAEAQRRRGRE